MPTRFAALDTGFPAFTGGESTEQKVEALHSFTYMLLEYLRYILRNLGPENLNQTEMKSWLDGMDIKAGSVVSDTVITNELYARYGGIADLAVDELRTDYAKAARYLAGDMSALDYLHIHNEEINYISGTVAMDGLAPLTEQLHHGTRYFYWTDSGMTQMTGEKTTPYPVIVYQYDELVKGTYRFDDVQEGGSTIKVPQLIFGAGYGNPADGDRGKGFLRKNTNSFDLWLLTNAGTRHGVFIGENHTDIVGLRKTLTMDFSRWDSGVFTETVDGDLGAEYSVTFDDQDRPVKITDGSGHETAVLW